jgi:RNA recognition motif. (a.k.a. RRM, RBD, or RNP domain)
MHFDSLGGLDYWSRSLGETRRASKKAPPAGSAERNLYACGCLVCCRGMRYRLLKFDAPFSAEHASTMTKIYVGNLPFSANEGEIRELFGQHGAVETVSLIMDRETGRPRGFGFVEMSREDATRAIQNLNGKELGGRALRVNEAQERTGGGGGPPRGAGPKRW